MTADYYELKFGDTEKLSNFITLSDITDTTVTVENLNYDSRYFWKVRGINSVDNGSWSDIYSFSTTQLKPDTVIVESPIDSTNNASIPVVFNWRQAYLANAYQLRISDSEDFSFFLILQSQIQLLC